MTTEEQTVVIEEAPPRKLSGAQRKNELRQKGVAAPSSIVQRGRPRPPDPPRIFHERWFGKKQATLIADIACRAPAGIMVEIGCWEGYSTYHIANAIHPRTLYAIDHWRGNEDEGVRHPSVIAARERDVYNAFLQNMHYWTRGNVSPIRADWHEALDGLAGAIAFAHIDAAHDYESVRATLAALYPRMVRGGILCGDDYVAAHLGRRDLNGGVERAVKELCIEHRLTLYARHNAWWTVKENA